MNIKILWPKDENLLITTNPMYKTSKEKMNEQFTQDITSKTYGYNIINDRIISINIVESFKVVSGMYVKIEFYEKDIKHEEGFYYIYNIQQQSKNTQESVYTIFLERDNFYDIKLYEIRGDIVSTSIKQFTYDNTKITSNVFNDTLQITKPYTQKLLIPNLKYVRNHSYGWYLHNQKILWGEIDTNKVLSDNIIRKPKFVINNPTFIKPETNEINEDYINTSIDIHKLTRLMGVDREEYYNYNRLENPILFVNEIVNFRDDWYKVKGGYLYVTTNGVNVVIREIYVKEIILNTLDINPGDYTQQNQTKINQHYGINIDFNSLNSPVNTINSTIPSFNIRLSDGSVITTDKIAFRYENQEFKTIMYYGTTMKTNDLIYHINQNTVDNDNGLRFLTNINFPLNLKYNPIIHLNQSFTQYSVVSGIVNHPILINQLFINNNKTDINFTYEYIIKYNETISKINYPTNDDKTILSKTLTFNDNDLIISSKASDYLLSNQQRRLVEKDKTIFNGFFGALSGVISTIGGGTNIRVGKKLDPILTPNSRYSVTTLSYARQTQSSIYNNAYQQLGSGIIGFIQSIGNSVFEERERNALYEDLKNQHIFKSGEINHEEEFGKNWYILIETISETQKQFYNNYFNRFGWVVNAYLNGISEDEIREEYDYIKLSNLEEIPGVSISVNNYLKQLFKEGIYYLKNPEDKYQIDFDKPWSE